MGAGTANGLVVFRLGEMRLALPLAAVERVVRAVEVTPLPQAPEIILGVINVQGRVIPVLDIRRRLGLPAREIDIEDQFLIARSRARTIALAVDEVLGIEDSAAGAVTEAEDLISGLRYVDGILKDADGLIPVCRLDGSLSPEEEKALDAAMEA